MQLNLVKDGVFPILYDENGELLSNTLDTGLKVSCTIQGEGFFVGTPSLFMRTSGCNLRCCWKNNVCDTSYSSIIPEKNLIETQVAANIIRANIGNVKHLVITGGEPLLQAKALTELLELIEDLNLIITIETNGTIYNEELFDRADLISISPKLSSSTPSIEKIKGTDIKDHWITKHEVERKNLSALQQCLTHANVRMSDTMFQLKFVVSDKKDIDEIIVDYLNVLKGWTPEDIYLMPEGITTEELREKSLWVMEECIKHNFNYCQRLHIDLFGKARSV